MLTSRAVAISRFTRNDATRLTIASGILVLILTAILGADFLPKETLTLKAGDIVGTDIVAPIAVSVAATLGLSVQPFMMALTVAGAASFLTPIATPASAWARGTATRA